MKNKITIKKSILINRPPDIVWDFTQDYSLRKTWDKSVKEAKIIQEHPNKMVSIKSVGGQAILFNYKYEKRPEKTTLAMMESKSFWVKGGGGSWSYEKQNGGTIWSQTNTIILRKGPLGAIARPFVSQLLKCNMGRGMKKAKQLIETI